MNKPIICVFATDEKMGFAKEGKIPWDVPDDRVFFKDFTTRTHSPGKMNAVIMGRRTWEDLPENHRPLKGRVNVVLTSSSLGDIGASSDVFQFSSFTDALKVLNQAPAIESIFVIGGERLLREAFNHPDCRLVVQSVITGDFECDQWLKPPITFKLTDLSPFGPIAIYWLIKDQDGN